MKAFDEGRYEEARTAVGRMLTSGRLPRTDYGGPLLVLGAIKIKDAEDQPTAERRRIEYSIAARYLTEARAYGIPENREATGDFLLGKSLIESGQFDEGVRVLNELSLARMAADPAVAIRVATIAGRHVSRHAESASGRGTAPQRRYCWPFKKLSDDQRSDALLQRAECLSRLEKIR